MAIKKSQLYSSLWSNCDELRGGMDASQYKDYVLVMLTGFDAPSCTYLYIDKSMQDHGLFQAICCHQPH